MYGLDVVKKCVRTCFSQVRSGPFGEYIATPVCALVLHSARIVIVVIFPNRFGKHQNAHTHVIGSCFDSSNPTSRRRVVGSTDRFGFVARRNRRVEFQTNRLQQWRATYAVVAHACTRHDLFAFAFCRQLQTIITVLSSSEKCLIEWRPCVIFCTSRHFLGNMYSYGILLLSREPR